jgi:hypothetical protein
MLFNAGMKFIDDIRRENMESLSSEKGGVAALARILGRSESQVSQWILGSPLPSGKKRGMKSETARWIEVVAEKPQGWLDIAHHPAPIVTAEPRLAEREATYLATPKNTRPLLQQVYELAERIDDAGLLKLQGYAACLLADHQLSKPKAA